MQNPIQIKKTIREKTDSTGFALGEISGYSEKYAIEFMRRRLDELPKGASNFLLEDIYPMLIY